MNGTCRLCGKAFEAAAERPGYEPKKFCSRSCRLAHQKAQNENAFNRSQRQYAWRKETYRVHHGPMPKGD